MIVTLEPDAAVPRVKIETTETTVYRMLDGESVPVRGLVDAGVMYDYEVPQETPVAYDDGLVVSDLVEMPDVGVWLIPPGQPELASPLLIDFDGLDGWTRAARVSIAEIPGRATSLAVSWARGARTGNLTVLGLDQDECDTLTACLDVAGPMYLSCPVTYWTAHGLSSTWVVVGDVAETPYGHDDDATWTVTFPITQVDRPVWVQASGVTWDDLASTWTALAPTWESLERA